MGHTKNILKQYLYNNNKNVSYLSVKMRPAVRRVFRQEVESQTGQDLIAVLVLPQQLQFTYADDVRVVPNFDKEKFTERQYFSLPVFVQILCSLVEGVGGVVPAGRPHELEEPAGARALLRIHSL